MMDNQEIFKKIMKSGLLDSKTLYECWRSTYSDSRLVENRNFADVLIHLGYLTIEQTKSILGEDTISSQVIDTSASGNRNMTSGKEKSSQSDSKPLQKTKEQSK